MDGCGIFEMGKRFFFEKADLQAIHTECVVRFLPNTSNQESKIGMFLLMVSIVSCNR